MINIIIIYNIKLLQWYKNIQKRISHKQNYKICAEEWGFKVNESKSIHRTFVLEHKICPKITFNNQPLQLPKMFVT